MENLYVVYLLLIYVIFEHRMWLWGAKNMFLSLRVCRGRDKSIRTVYRASEGEDDLELRRFIGKGGERYLSLSRTSRCTVNWAACGLSFVWCFYRKMIREGILCMLAILGIVAVACLAFWLGTRPADSRMEEAEAVLASAEAVGRGAASKTTGYVRAQAAYEAAGRAYGATAAGCASGAVAAVIAVNMTLGLLADRLYLSHVHRQIDTAGFWFGRSSDQLSRIGGVSYGYPAFFAGIFLLLAAKCAQTLLELL